MYNVGLIGAEGHEKYTLVPMENRSNTRLVAVGKDQGMSIDVYKNFSPFTSQTRVYEDYHDMLQEEDLDIVSVYSIHGTRCEAILYSAAAGCHIYTEKPLSMTLEQLARVKEAIHKAGVALTMMLNMRFGGVYRRVRDIVQSGDIGEVTQCSSQKSYKVGSRAEWSRNRTTFAGTIPYIACHALDLIRWCSGLELVKGSAFHNNVGNPYLKDMENTASILALMENGATLTTRMDYCRPGNASSWGDDRLRIVGTKGVVEVMFGKVYLLTEKKTRHEVDPMDNISQFENFIAHIEGKEDLVIPAEDCYRITEIVLKLRNAADQQTMVDL